VLHDWCTCPCTGFSFGERGQLDLVRTRAGAPLERLHLAELFDGGVARMRRWPVRAFDLKRCIEKDDNDGPTMTDLAARAPVDVMNVADYDRDGRATEFVLQVDAGPCGHDSSLLVGISREIPHLHAFGTAEAPSEPLMLGHLTDWERLRHASRITAIETGCGDHGSDVERALDLTADGRLHAKERTRTCP
jgi:hypothetical protein